MNSGKRPRNLFRTLATREKAIRFCAPMFSAIVQAFGKLLPSCFTALRLAENGAERKLKPHEKVALRYHGRLCPHCNCAQRKFDKAIAAMREAEHARKR